MTRRLILASASPRRQELLQDLSYPFDIVAADCEEYFDRSLPIASAIEQIARQKALTVWEQHPEAVVLGADTMVCFKDQMMGKPENREDAYRMLKQLSGKTHTVVSGVAIVWKGKAEFFHEKTSVTFYELEEELLERYLDSNELYDKAGAYGIQGMGKLFVRELRGDYFNVMGLPIAAVYRHLKAYLEKTKKFCFMVEKIGNAYYNIIAFQS